MGEQGRAAPDPAPARPSREWSAFAASLPLFVVSVGLFVGSVVVFTIAPGAGPGGFPLWGLLLTLGFIAAIGTTVSWFFATGEEDDRPSTIPLSHDSAPDLGRPAPDVRRATELEAAPDWDESVIAPRASPRPAVAQAAPPLVRHDDIERALDEIAEIEDELEGRPTLRRPPAPARS
jgi:hypothetical protein